MSRYPFSLTALCCLAIVFAGCSKKAPNSPPIVTSPAEVAAPAPTPTPETDATEAALPTDLQELNAELARRGLLGDVYFALDRFELDEPSRERLARNASFLKSHREYLVTIEGHCDERGTNEYNLALGDRRASAALNYVTSLGVATGSVRTVSYGEERPQCSEDGEGCWSRNRRAHFLITGRSSGS